jgi:hypothetical protein
MRSEKREPSRCAVRHHDSHAQSCVLEATEQQAKGNINHTEERRQWLFPISHTHSHYSPRAPCNRPLNLVETAAACRQESSASRSGASPEPPVLFATHLVEPVRPPTRACSSLLSSHPPTPRGRGTAYTITKEALCWIIRGGVMPRGRTHGIVCVTESVGPPPLRPWPPVEKTP